MEQIYLSAGVTCSLPLKKKKKKQGHGSMLFDDCSAQGLAPSVDGEVMVARKSTLK